MRFSFMHSRQPGEEIKMILPQTYIHTYIHTYIYTYIQYIHINIHIYLPSYLPTSIHTLPADTPRSPNIHTYEHTNSKIDNRRT